jgi:hypothetical protein
MRPLRAIGFGVTLALVAGVTLAARPGTEQQLIQQLNGQPVRVKMADGGAWGIFTQYDGGSANSFGCAPMTGLTSNTGGAVSANVVVFVPLVPVNVCMMPSVNGRAWDGGCNAIPTDLNYGMPLTTGVPQYMTPDSVATSICAVSDAGFVSMPMMWAQ